MHPGTSRNAPSNAQAKRVRAELAEGLIFSFSPLIVLLLAGKCKKDCFFFDAAVEPLRFLLHAHDQGCYFPCLFGFL